MRRQGRIFGTQDLGFDRNLPLKSFSGVQSHLFFAVIHRSRLIAVITLAAFLVTGCGRSKPGAPPPPFVQVIQVESTGVPLHTTLIGQLDSPQNVEIRARVEGVVEASHFTEGTEIEAGQLLFTLDKQPFVERLAAANGMLAEAEASLHKSQRNVERLTPLVANRAVPQQDLDNARAAVEAAQAGVESAKARVESAQLDLGYCEIKAPVAGLIGAKEVSIGELVGRGQPTLMATLSTLDPIWFYCNVSEVEYIQAEERSRALGRDVSTLPLTLLLAHGKEHPEGGKFVFIDRAVNSQTGTLRVRAEFPNPEKLLRPGMFARVRVELGTRENAILVPQRAITQLQGRNFVWVVDGENIASQRAVEVGEQVDANLIVTNGLEAGEQIIVEGTNKAREGTPVTAMTAEEFAAMAAAGTTAAKN
ncbi:MAG: efflux RND transporter periplasmic adaptor subunit [Luteolibacter sp.]